MGSFFCVLKLCVLYHEPSALATDNSYQLLIETPSRGKGAFLCLAIETPNRGNH